LIFKSTKNHINNVLVCDKGRIRNNNEDDEYSDDLWEDETNY